MHKLTLDDATASAQPAQPTSQAYPQYPVDEPVQNHHTINSLGTQLRKDTMTRSPKTLFIVGLFAIIGGLATGYGGYKLQAQSSPSDPTKGIKQVAEGTVQKGDVYGVKDEKTFKDSAEGYLEAGGLDGEGSHKLLRPGGESQTVYLTSSVTDLDKLVGMEVKVWGETFKGQKAGWLMDVGRVEVVNPDGTPPSEE